MSRLVSVPLGTDAIRSHCQGSPLEEPSGANGEEFGDQWRNEAAFVTEDSVIYQFEFCYFSISFLGLVVVVVNSRELWQP